MNDQLLERIDAEIDELAKAMSVMQFRSRALRWMRRPTVAPAEFTMRVTGNPHFVISEPYYCLAQQVADIICPGSTVELQPTTLLPAPPDAFDWSERE